MSQELLDLNIFRDAMRVLANASKADSKADRRACMRSAITLSCTVKDPSMVEDILELYGAVATECAWSDTLRAKNEPS